MLTGRGPGRGTLRSVEVRGQQVWQADWTGADGKRHRRFLGRNRRDAERALARIIDERDAELMGVARPSGLDMPLESVIAQYLADLRTRARRQTIHDANVAMTRIAREAALRSVRDVTKARIMEWRERRVRGGASHKTANTEVSTLSAAINLAVRLDQVATNPLQGLRALPVTAQHRRRLPRALNEAEIARLLHAAMVHDRTHAGLPRGPLLRTLIETGARWSEAVAVTWVDLDFDRGELRLRPETTKTKVERVIPIRGELLDVIAEMRAQQAIRAGHEPRPHDGIFLTPEGKRWPKNGARFRAWLAKILQRAGIERVDANGRVVHVHAMRHTFATRLARHGVPVQTAATLTGHRSISVLMGVYTHLASEDAKAAIRALPPLPTSGSLPSA